MKFSTVVAFFAVLALATCAHASIIDSSYHPDTDGVFTMPGGAVTAYLESGEDEYEMEINGILHEGPLLDGTVGHLVGWCDTNSPTDPTIKALNSITNDDTFAWTGMTVNVSISGTGVLPVGSEPLLSLLPTPVTPTDWSATIVSPMTWDGSKYIGTVQYNAGTPVAIGSDLDFNYKVSFSGATHYEFIQEMIPVPEPGTLALLACGFVGLLISRRRFAR